MASLIDNGKVDVKVTASYPFDATPEALPRLGKEHVRGKIVVELANG
jgi:NADPH:quinone reductase-like Zn-dependent oxidoreductase